MIVLRLLLVVPPALAFLWFGGRDALLHQRARVVGAAEAVIHAGLGAAELALIAGAAIGAPLWLLGGASATAILGALDEYRFHRQLPPEEADAHAKGHFALFWLLTAAFAALAIEAHAAR